MRDIENDSIANKNTLVVKFGLKWAKQYQHFLIIVPFLCLFVFSIGVKTKIFLSIFVFIFLLKHLEKVRKSTTPEEFDPELKKVALGTFVLSILIWISFFINKY